MSTALVVMEAEVQQSKPLTHSQIGWKCQRAAVKLQNRAWKEKDRAVEKATIRVSEALFSAAVCFLAAAEKGNKRSLRDAADGAKAFARAVKLAGGDVNLMERYITPLLQR